MAIEIQIFVHHSFDPITVVPPGQSGIEQALADLKGGLEAMNQKLSDAVAALIATTNDETTKLDSITTYVKGVPDVVAAAVRDALAAANVDEETAAAQIEAQRTAIAAKVDDTLAAVSANTPPTDTGNATTQDNPA